MVPKIKIYALFYIVAVQMSIVEAQQKAVQRDTSLAAHFEQGVQLFNEHDDTGEALDEAEKEFQFIVRVSPRYAPAHAYLGLIALERQQPERAETFIKQALAIDFSCPEAHIGKARLLRLRSQWEQGFAELRLAVQLAPTSMIALDELTLTLLHSADQQPPSTERINEALPYLNKIVEFDHDARQAHLDLAESYERLGRLRDAVKHYREVLRIGQMPDDGDVWVYTIHETVAGCLEKLGEYEQAWKELELYLAELKRIGDTETMKAVEPRIRELRKKVKR